VTELGGFAHETNPSLKVHDVILDLMQLDAAQYSAECEASSATMEMYSMDSVMAQYNGLFIVPSELILSQPASRVVTFRRYCDFVLLLRRLRRLCRKVLRLS
jgi:hypothetical protein